MKYKNIKLGEAAEITMGQSPKSTYYNKEGMGIPFIQGVSTFGNNYPRIETYTTEYNKEAQKGDLLFSVRAPVGRINVANQTIAIGRGLASLKVKKGYSKSYIYYLFKKKFIFILKFAFFCPATANPYRFYVDNGYHFHYIIQSNF